MVTVHRMPNGDPFAIVIDPDASATASVAPDGSAVTVVFRQEGKTPCSLIVPESVAPQAFGPNYGAMFSDGAAASNEGDL